MRQLWLVVALSGAGCNQLLGIDELTRVDGGGGTTDGPVIDARPIDSPAGSICAMLVTPAACFSPLPAGSITLGDINTDDDAMCTELIGSSICVIAADSITIPGGTSTIRGTRALMLVATTTIRVAGILDASSTTGGQRGAGSELVPACGTLAAAAAANDGGGGGAGGTFGSKGGDGGRGAGSNGTLGAIARPVQATTSFHAGCRGSGGGNTGSGPAGYGGGALYLVAGASISIENRIDANGSGGTGANSGEAGGGGGGSGGMIVLEAPSITLDGADAQITANGGGGGEGTIATNAAEGGESDAWDEAGTGGTEGSPNGGAGGPGAIASGMGGPGAPGTSAGGGNNDGGGGGGGGGVGVVWIKGTAPTGPQAGRISPPPTYP